MSYNETMQKQYEQLGICREVYEFGSRIEDRLKERFQKLDETAE